MPFAYNLDNQFTYFSKQKKIVIPETNMCICIYPNIVAFVVDEMLNIIYNNASQTQMVIGIKQLLNVGNKIVLIFEDRVTVCDVNQQITYNIAGVTDIIKLPFISNNGFNNPYIYFMRGNKIYKFNDVETEILKEYDVKYIWNCSDLYLRFITEEPSLNKHYLYDYEFNNKVKQTEFTYKFCYLNNHIIIDETRYSVIICPNRKIAVIPNSFDFDDKLKFVDIESNDTTIMTTKIDQSTEFYNISRNYNVEVVFEGNLNKQIPIKSARNV